MLKTKFKIGLIKKILLSIAILPNLCLAQNSINLGALDIKTTDQQELIKININPGEKIEKGIQISNFSTSDKKLSIYVADAEENQSKKFIANDRNEISEDIFPWINLNNEEILLKAGESKIIPISIKIPANAGVGLHTGAIMFSERENNNENIINWEKGIRLYLNVNGQASPGIKSKNFSNSETSRFLNHSETLVNTGNTDLKGEITFQISNQDYQTISAQSEKYFLKPGQSKDINLHLEKPTPGFYHLSINQTPTNQETKTIFSKDKLIFPFEIYYLMGLISLVLVYFAVRALTKVKLGKINLIPSFNSPILQRTFAFVSLFAIATTVAANLAIENNFNLADIFSPSENHNYLTTIKWGNLEKKNLPDSYHTNWKGSFSVKNGKLNISNKLHLEKNDILKINPEKTILYFENQTGPDNDGVTLLIEPTDQNISPILTYNNLYSREEKQITLSKNLKYSSLFRYKLHSVQIKSELIAAEVIKPEIKPEDILTTPPAEIAQPTENVQPSETTISTTENTPATETTANQNESSSTPSENPTPTQPSPTAETTQPTEISPTSEPTTPSSESSPTTPETNITPAEIGQPIEAANPAETNLPTEITPPTESTQPAETQPTAEITQPSSENQPTITETTSTKEINLTEQPATTPTEATQPTETTTQPSEYINQIESTSPEGTTTVTPVEPTTPVETTPPVETTSTTETSATSPLTTIEQIISEITATSEIFSNFIVNPNSLTEISSSDEFKTITTSAITLENLRQNLPVLHEITSSPELNFVFIPNEKISFSPQQFSFNKSRKTTQDLGQIIFVQNRTTNWNVYLTSTDFVALSGKNRISASSVSIIPGNIEVVGGPNDNSILSAGNTTQINNSDDQALLVSIEPKNNTETIFIMKPKISIEIPTGTNPGVYRGEISIKVI